MPAWMLPSKFGVVLALLYLVFVIWVVVTERSDSGGGGWISLPGMATWLVTFPVSAPMDFMGMKPDFRKNIDMTLTVGLCTALIYFIGAGAEWLARSMFSTGARG